MLGAEEVVRMARDKLIRLQGLYRDYMRLIQHQLRINNLKHRHLIKEEHDKFGSPLPPRPPSSLAPVGI